MPVLAVYAAGYAIGGAIGGTFLGVSAAAIGGTLATVAYNAAFAPTAHGEGPRLSDLKAGQVTYGSVVPYIEGHPRIAGTIVYASEKREMSTTSHSGKGGGGSDQTTFTYEQDLMIMLSENMVGGVRKIWRNGELIWTTANDGDAASVANVSELWTRMTFYSGASDQLPDPTYEAALGAGNAPAYRTRSCVFFEGLQLGPTGQLSSITFELAPAGGAINPAIFDAPLGSDVQDTIPLLAGATVTHSAGITFDGTWATFAGVAGTGNPQVDYTADKFIPASVRPIVYDFNFSNVQKIDGPYYSLGGSCGVVEFIVAEALAAYNAAHFGGWVVAAGYPTYDIHGVPLKLKFSRTVSGAHDEWRVPHFYAGPEPNGSDDYGPIDDPDHPYAYKLSGEEAATLGVPYFAANHPGREAVYLSTTHGVGTIRIAHYTVRDAGTGANASTLDEQLNWLSFSSYYEESAEITFNTCTPGGGDPPNTSDYQFVFTLTQSPDSVAFGFKVVAGVLHLAAAVNGVAVDLGAYSPPGGGVSAVQIWLNAAGDGSVQWYVDTVLKHTDTSAAAFGTMTLAGFGVDATAHTLSPYGISAWDVQHLTIRMGASGTIGLVEPTLQEVVERQCVRGGLSLDFVDATALATRKVRAMPLTQISSPRQVIEMLLSAYGAQVVESDVLRFSWRGGASAATIPYEHLVQKDGEPLPITKVNDVELPCQVFVKYSNVYDDYQDGTEASDRLISTSQNTSLVELPLGFTPTEAKRLADFHVTDAASAALRFGPFGLDRRYSKLEPGDAVIITAQEGSQFRVRLTKKDEAAGVLTFEGVSDEASVSVATSVARTSTGGYTNSTGVGLPVDTVLALLDIPILSDVDDDAGFYATAKAATDASFPGAVLFDSLDNVTYASVGSTTQAGTFGVATTTLGNGVTSVFDEANAVTVNVGFGQLYSYTRDNILDGIAPAYLLGAEVFYARNATLVSTGIYTLTGLLRGRRGTEWAVGAHGAAEVFAVLDAAVKRVPMDNADIGVSRWWKGVTTGRSSSTATAVVFTDTAVGKKPFSPVNVRRAVSGADAIITWDRRSRFEQNLSIGSIVLGEESEAYEIDITVSGVTTTYTSTGPSLTVTGGASSLIAGSQINVYQMSALVGRGYAGALTL